MFWHWKTPGRRKACISARVRCPILSASLYRTLRGGQTGLVCYIRISEMGHDFLHGGGSADSGDYRREDARIRDCVSSAIFPAGAGKDGGHGSQSGKIHCKTSVSDTQKHCPGSKIGARSRRAYRCRKNGRLSR